MIQVVALFATLALLAAAPVAAVIAVWYLCSSGRAARICFKVARGIVVALNVVLIATGLWGFAMITTAFNYDGPFIFNKMLLPITVFVLAAGPIKSLRVATKSRQRSCLATKTTKRD